MPDLSHDRDERIAEHAQRYTASFVSGMEVGRLAAKRSFDLFEVAKIPVNPSKVIINACMASMNRVFDNPAVEHGEIEAARYGAEIAAQEFLAERLEHAA